MLDTYGSAYVYVVKVGIVWNNKPALQELVIVNDLDCIKFEILK